MIYIYYAIQLPCNPEFDFNVAFYNKDRILEAMKSNYGKDFHFEEKDEDPYGNPICYVYSNQGECYARVVCILLRQ